MNTQRIARDWHDLAGSAREHWVRLTADDVARIEGDRDRLVGILQERYGYARERAEWEIDAWVCEEASGGSHQRPDFPRREEPREETSPADASGIIEGEFESQPGSTPRTNQRAFGTGLLLFASFLILIGVFAGFFILPFALVAVVGLALVPAGTKLFREGRSKPHEANPYE